jgi:hypothetical protein
MPWLNKNNDLITNLKTFIKLSVFYINHLIKKGEEIYSDNYAIINDSAHNYNLLTFYTSPEFLKKQLTDNGFTEIELLLKNGDRSTPNKLDDWIFVTCKKLLS